MTEIAFHEDLVLPPAKYEYLDHTADVHLKMNGVQKIDVPQWSAWRAEDRQKEGMFATGTIKTVAEQIRREQLLKKQQLKLMMEDELYRLKERPPQVYYPVSKQVPGAACKFCTDEGELAKLDMSNRRRNLINVVDSWRINYSSLCPQFIHCLRFKQYEYLTLVIPQPDQQKEDSENERRLPTTAITTMISDPFLRLTSWLLYKILPSFVSSLTIHPASIEALKLVSEQNPGIPMIFLPLHRSILDQLLVNFILLNNDVKVPLTFMDESLNLPVFGSILHRLGVVFVKKFIDVNEGRNNLDYQSTIKSFIHQALKSGHNLQIFLEGNPTTNGKTKLPFKTGLLASILETVEQGVINDVLLVPISINYEKLPEGGIISKELGLKTIPTFFNTVRVLKKVLSSQAGQVRADIHEPFSLKNLIKTAKLKYNTQREFPHHHNRRLIDLSTTSIQAIDASEDLKTRHFIKRITEHVVFNATLSQPIMCTNLVAFLLLSKYRNVPVSLDNLSSDLDKLREELSLKNIAFNGSSKDVILYVAALLGPNLIIVSEENDQMAISATNEMPYVIELRYYANLLSPIFAVDSLILTATNFLAVKYAPYGRVGEDLEFPEYELQKVVSELADILRYEFVFHKPCQSFDNVIADTVASLSDRGLLFKVVNEMTEDEFRAGRLANYLFNDCIVDSESDSESETEEQKEYKLMKESPKIQLPHDTEFERVARTSLIRPIIYCYAMTAECLKTIIGLDCILETEFIGFCIRFLRSQVEVGNCDYGECISATTIQNALKLFEKWDVVNISTNRGVRVLSLANSLYNSSIALDAIVEQIQKFYY